MNSGMNDVKHTCTNCDLRHGGCCSGTYWLDDCPEFVIGKCYRCKHNADEPEGICLGEDMSGEGCPNFAE